MKLKTEWDLSFLYNGIDDPAIALEDKEADRIITAFSKKRKNNEKYLSDVDTLLEALNEYSEIHGNYRFGTKSSIYFWLLSEINQDEEIKSLYNKHFNESNALMLSISFFSLSLTKLSKDKQEEFLEDSKLEEYHQYLKDQFIMFPYMLTEKEEKIFSIMRKTSLDNRTQMISDFLSLQKGSIVLKDGTEKKLTASELGRYLTDQNKNYRDQAAQQYYSIVNDHVKVAEVEFNNVLEYKKNYDEIRGFSRPDSSRHLEDNVSTGVVDALVESVSGSFDFTRKYFSLKKKLLGFDTLKYHERLISYTGGGNEKIYEFEEGYKLVHDALSGLDVDFTSLFESFVKKGQIDAMPKVGKRGGGFNAGLGKNVGNLILMNYTGKLSSVLTLAHETGHAIHAELGRKQNSLYYGHGGMFVAEVGSTFIENVVFDHILESCDDETRLTMLIEKLDNICSAVYRQIAGYNFEKEVHKEFRSKGYLSAETIGSLFSKHISSYMGDDVEQTLGSENWWVQWKHFRYFFYIYTYASGVLIAQSLHSRVKKDPSFMKVIKNNFYSVGSAKSPKEIFLSMGIDIEKKDFWLQGINEFYTLLSEATELAKKLGKIK